MPGTTSIFKSYFDIGKPANLAKDLNSIFEFENASGFSTVTIDVKIPTGGQVIFEGSTNGLDWFPITLRGITTDGYLQKTSTSETFIGSINGLRKFRVRVTVAGSANGSVQGRVQKGLSILEGLEHGNPPHQIGYQIKRKGFDFSTAQSGTIIWPAVAERKIVITAFNIIASGSTDALTSIYQDTNISDNWLLRGQLDVSVNSPIIMTQNLGSGPFVADIGKAIKLDTTSAVKISGVLYGYEAEI